MIIYQFRINSDFFVNHKKASLLANITADVCKVLLLVSIVLRYQVWFKWN